MAEGSADGPEADGGRPANRCRGVSIGTGCVLGDLLARVADARRRAEQGEVEVLDGMAVLTRLLASQLADGGCGSARCSIGIQDELERLVAAIMSLRGEMRDELAQLERTRRAVRAYREAH